MTLPTIALRLGPFTAPLVGEVQSARRTGEILNPTGYFLGSGSAELDRLRLQAQIYEEHTRWLLDRIPIQPGWRALDVACGPVGIVPLLAERVGPTGEVIGLDSDQRMVENARALVVDQRLTSTQIVVGDARRTGLPSSQFDLVHERLLLVNVPDPESVLAEMIRLRAPVASCSPKKLIRCRGCASHHIQLGIGC